MGSIPPVLVANGSEPADRPSHFAFSRLSVPLDRVNRRQAPWFLGAGLAIGGFWAYLGVAFAESGYVNAGAFVGLSLPLGAGTLTGAGGFLLLWRSQFPSGLTEDETGFTLEYPSRPAWEIAWSDPALELFLIDQRRATEAWTLEGAPCWAQLVGAPWVRGRYFPIPSRALERLGERARQMNLPIRTAGLTFRGNTPFAEGTAVSRIRSRAPSKGGVGSTAGPGSIPPADPEADGSDSPAPMP